MLVTRTAELVSTGSELLSGRTLNRHAQVLGSLLRSLGIRLVRDMTIGDDVETIVDAVGAALSRTDIVLVSGGLGPTSDDMTRDAIAQLLGRSIHLDADTVALLKKRYEERGLTMSAESERQAQAIDGAVVMQNPAGAAPGQRIELDGGKVLFVLPGPPREFLAVLETHILPWLREQDVEQSAALERVFMLGGYPESKAARKFEQAGIPDPADGLEIGYCASPGQLEVRLLGPADRLDAMNRNCDRVREMLGDAIYAEERISIEEALVRRLLARAQTVGTVEFGSVGVLAQRLATTPGGPAGFAGGLVATSNAVLIREFGVSADLIAQHGSVSKPVARHLASAARVKFGSQIGCAVSGVTTDDEGDDLKRPGQVFIAIDNGGDVACRAYNYTGTRGDVGIWCAQSALNQLLRTLR